MRCDAMGSGDPLSSDRSHGAVLQLSKYLGMYYVRSADPSIRLSDDVPGVACKPANRAEGYHVCFVLFCTQYLHTTCPLTMLPIYEWISCMRSGGRLKWVEWPPASDKIPKHPQCKSKYAGHWSFFRVLACGRDFPARSPTSPCIVSSLPSVRTPGPGSGYLHTYTLHRQHRRCPKI